MEPCKSNRITFFVVLNIAVWKQKTLEFHLRLRSDDIPVITVLFAVQPEVIVGLEAVLHDWHVERELLQARGIVVQHKAAQLHRLFALYGHQPEIISIFSSQVHCGRCTVCHWFTKLQTNSNQLSMIDFWTQKRQTRQTCKRLRLAAFQKMWFPPVNWWAWDQFQRCWKICWQLAMPSTNWFTNSQQTRINFQCLDQFSVHNKAFFSFQGKR